MSFPNISQEPNKQEQINPYSISVKEFKEEPEKIESYEVEDSNGKITKITRDNFTSFLIQSFAISRGTPGIQVLFMEWLKIRSGFDYSKTLNNFITAGGWDKLSDSEKKEFENEFSKIKEHTKRWMLIEFQERIADGLEDLMDIIRKGLNEKEMETLGILNLGTVDTFKKFSEFAHQKREDLRTKTI